MQFDPRLYLVTERSHLDGRDFLHVVELALQGGATMVQLREKNASGREFLELALALRPLTRKYNVPLWINDRVDIALAAEADGVHLGQSDLPADAARRIIPRKMLLGISVGTVEQALAAEAAGADLLGSGAVFPTATKDDAEAVAQSTLADICSAVRIPVVAIGGITLQNLHIPMAAGVAGVAVVSAIMNPPDTLAATRDLRAEIDRCLQK